MVDRSRILIGLVGCGIQSSLSPQLHEHEGAALGISYSYRLIDIDESAVQPSTLGAMLDEIERQGFQGFNVTHPFKQMIIPHLDRLSDDARALGAVNTVLFKDGARVGHNTDWLGFAESLRRRMSTAPKDRLILVGAGGAGAAVAHATMVVGAKHVGIFDMDLARAGRLVDQVARQFGEDRAALVDDLPTAIRNAQGVINATPVGMDHMPGSPIDPSLLRADLWVADIIYFPLDTQLLRDARATGCVTMDGGGMAVIQAAEAFKLFSGAAPDTERMLRHFAELTIDKSAAPRAAKISA